MGARGKGLRTGFRRDDRGATAVEFALVAVPFLGVLALMLDLGIGFLVERNLDAAVQNAARQIRTGAVQGQSIVTASDFVNGYVCPAKGSLMSSIVDCSKLIVDVRTATAFTGNDLSSDFYKTQSTNQFCLGSPQVITIVRVTYPFPWLIPVLVPGGVQSFGLVNDVPNNPGWKLLLTSATAVRTEPYPSAQYAAYAKAKGC